MKITGAELAAFEREAFPNGYLWDHELYDHAPVPEQVYDTDMIEGPFWGAGRSRLPDGQQMNLDLDTLIEAWRASRAYDTVLIRIPRKEGAAASVEDIRAAAALLTSNRDACLDIAGILGKRSDVISAEAVQSALGSLLEMPDAAAPKDPDQVSP